MRAARLVAVERCFACRVAVSLNRLSSVSPRTNARVILEAVATAPRGDEMATFYAPRISAEDYPAFQNMPGLDLPATYEDWLQQQARGSGENGYAVIEVDVNPSEFVRYLQASKAIANLKELQAFASAKAGVATIN
jgi:hypothetical protein